MLTTYGSIAKVFVLRFLRHLYREIPTGTVTRYLRGVPRINIKFELFLKKIIESNYSEDQLNASGL